MLQRQQHCQQQQLQKQQMQQQQQLLQRPVSFYFNIEVFQSLIINESPMVKENDNDCHKEAEMFAPESWSS